LFIVLKIKALNAQKGRWGSGQGKVVPVLNKVIFHTFLTFILDGGEWLASCSSSFTPRERAPGTHWIGGKYR